MPLPSVPRKLCSHHDKLVMAAQASPLWCHGFCNPEIFVTKRLIQHAITRAKTRATPMLRRQHIPPNVSHKHYEDYTEHPVNWIIVHVP